MKGDLTMSVTLTVSPFIGGIDPKVYMAFITKLDALMSEARTLGLFRTQEFIHGALREARAEIPEAMPPRTGEVRIPFGPVATQDRYK